LFFRHAVFLPRRFYATPAILDYNCGAMRRRFFVVAFGLAALPWLFPAASAHSDDLTQTLREEYQGKTLLLRGFYSGDHLRYDSSGAAVAPASGDWTDSGFVRIIDLRFSGDKLIIRAQRMAAQFDARQFELRPLERQTRKNTKEPALVEMNADAGMHNPSPEQVEGLIAKIFLTSQDSMLELVPDYWKSCVGRALGGTDKECAFSPEILAIPGVASGSRDNSADSAANNDTRNSKRFLVGGGVSPPRVIYSPEPEFSDSARVEKFQGIVVLKLNVDQEGTPRGVRIQRPLGCGLDAKAVQAVQNWKFTPSEKDGVPVNVEIAVEVSFHLY
jgi:TonB family protein